MFYSLLEKVPRGCLRIKAIIQSARINSISPNEVTVVDNTSWVGIHVYAMRS